MTPVGVRVLPATSSAAVYQPKKKPAGTVVSAFFIPDAPPRPTGVQRTSVKSGLRYEKKVFDHLRWLYQENVRIQPWLQYENSHYTRRTCQPDALILYEDKLVIFEVKRTHSLDSWFQLEKIYSPVLRQIFPDKPQLLVSLSSGFDPQIGWPSPLHLCDGFSDLATVPEGHAAIQWREKDWIP